MHPIEDNTTTAEMGTVLLTGRLLDLGSEGGDTDRDQNSDLCTFTSCSFKIDFSDLRTRRQNEQSPIEISNDDGSGIFAVNIDVTPECEMIDWYRENSNGFAISRPEGELDIYDSWNNQSEIPTQPVLSTKCVQDPKEIQCKVIRFVTSEPLDA